MFSSTPYALHRRLPALEGGHADWPRLIQAYQAMATIRCFDKKAVNLQRTGQLGTYASCLGAEAITVGAGLALQDSDYFVPYYRDHATQHLRGVPLYQILQYWGGDERGNAFPADTAAARDLPNCVPIASQLTQAAGIATKAKLRHEPAAVLATCGDGATSRGDFYESLNVAGVWQLPLVLMVNNNQWAISVPGQLQTASKTLAHKAEAAGIEGIRVDGNDLPAMLDVLDYALDKARHGKGATLVEAVSYRLSDHTTADDASRYRKASDLHAAWQREPVARLRQALVDAGHWDAEQEKDWQAHCQQEVDKAVKTYLDQPPQSPTDMFDYLYANLPVSLEKQRAALTESAGGHHA
ncbi:pyruvate dehydrogenase (acetyl-transferring) E1 component subunit alpha [Alcanivorax sp. S6407]|uniref:pyruvate dehydrogenase (acetyl-transferring) E1 component subunit alpha n=1 Tax=Alcanivorax sp. S6407 TaxID=2926424 RepID=UPI001FF36522|nr:pyruvate dehydrogenase (acetyl-transferring) E1 component subunit alpha [Alcanivorax sp. S6407]MCK0152750.1 pyruvate dehydrogenase (acetyl-transferring) E1 component subunit alpha [Alcanivorax sp. S6407]